MLKQGGSEVGTPLSSGNTVMKEVDSEVIKANTDQGPDIQMKVPPESEATDNPRALEVMAEPGQVCSFPKMGK